jgi:alkylhydroperoxidase family enzyme
VLADYRTAPISDKLRATLGFLEKMTLAPQELGAADAQAVRDAGVSDEALLQAAYVATLFNIMDRVADALGFRPNDAQGLRWVRRILLGFGYTSSVVP